MKNSEQMRRNQYARHAKKVGMSVDHYILRRKLEKWCPRCMRWLPIPSFQSRSGLPMSTHDGLYSYCKACRYSRSKMS
jgi:hypothetical protein